jgi:dihydroflavonol-4-reductase
LPLNIDRARDYAAGSWLCSPKRAIEELGFCVETPLVERVRQTIAWYRAEGWLVGNGFQPLARFGRRGS